MNTATALPATATRVHKQVEAWCATYGGRLQAQAGQAPPCCATSSRELLQLAMGPVGLSMTLAARAMPP